MQKFILILIISLSGVLSYAQAPVNDDPCGAITLTPNIAPTLPNCVATTPISWANATSTSTSIIASSTCGTSTGLKDVWYKIVVPTGVDSILINTKAGNISDAVISLYSAALCNGPFSLIQCNDDSATGINLMPFIKTAVTPNTYYLRVWAYNTAVASANIFICINLKGAVPAIDPSKKVGVNIFFPEANLDVNGTSLFRSDATFEGGVKIISSSPAEGSVLTSDAVGNATWRAANASGSVGFGTWGDCSMNNISEFNPVFDSVATDANNFGYCVSISGNLAIVGSPNATVGANTRQGNAYMYKFDGTKWNLTQTINNPSGNAFDNFGNTVTISGNFAVVGTPYHDNGGVFNQGCFTIYKYNGTTWVFVQQIFDGTGAAGDNFGFSACILNNMLIVGSPYDDFGANNNQGSASIYKFDGTNWLFNQKITGAAGANYLFGMSVSIQDNIAVIGAPTLSPTGFGSTYVFKFGASWLQTQQLLATTAGGDFGSSVSVNNGQLVTGEPLTNNGRGKVYTYTLNIGTGITSNPQTILLNNAADFSYFGQNVYISGNYLIAAANNSVNGSYAQGSVTIYQKIGTQWRKLQYLYSPDGEAGDNFGYGISVDGVTKRFLIGIPRTGNPGQATFGKINQ